MSLSPSQESLGPSIIFTDGFDFYGTINSLEDWSTLMKWWAPKDYAFLERPSIGAAWVLGCERTR